MLALLLSVINPIVEDFAARQRRFHDGFNALICLGFRWRMF
jgi:hypothetical protein